MIQPPGWICPECQDDRHHETGDRVCLRQSIRNLTLELEELKAANGKAEVFWVLYDSKAKQSYIKKSQYDGSLKFYDCEREARAAKKNYRNTDYVMVEYFRKNVNQEQN